MKNVISQIRPQWVAFWLIIKTNVNGIGRYLKDFRLLHNDVQVILLLLSIFILPAYLLTGHFFDLLTQFHILFQGGDGDSLVFMSRLVETGVIIYSIVIWLYYHLGIEEAKKEVKKNYPGAHECIRKSSVPSHLLFNELKPDDENKSVFSDGFRDLGNNEDEFLTDNPQVYKFLKDESAYKEAYEAAFSDDIKSATTTNTEQEGPRYVSLLDKLNELPDEL